METVIITGSSGLIGSEAVRFFSEKGMRVIGVDNDMRREFFGEEASTEWNRKQLEEGAWIWMAYESLMNVDHRNI